MHEAGSGMVNGHVYGPLSFALLLPRDVLGPVNGARGSPISALQRTRVCSQNVSGFAFVATIFPESVTVTAWMASGFAKLRSMAPVIVCPSKYDGR